MAWHLYEKGPERSPNLENYSFRVFLALHVQIACLLSLMDPKVGMLRASERRSVPASWM